MTLAKSIPGRFAVAGNPIAHSLSPKIHAAFASQYNSAIHYSAELVAQDLFEDWVSQFFQEGGRGLNVTLPFKIRAFELADQASDRARAAGAANFLTVSDDGRLLADNTDGKGLIADIVTNAGWSVADARVLLLGAGGAVKGVIAALLAEGPRSIFIANRTADRSAALAALWSGERCSVVGGAYAEIPEGPWDMVVNGTSTGLSGEMLPLPESLTLAGDGVCYDMAYGAQPTSFMRWAQAHGAAQVRDGLGMLVEQAAESFYLWTGNAPRTDTVITALREGQLG